MKKKYLTIIFLIIIMLFSIYNLYNSKVMLKSYSNYYIKELIWWVIGFLVIIISSRLNLDIIFKKSKYLYVLGIILLVITHFFGITINGSTSWLKVGLVSIQPSEFMKIPLILSLRSISLRNYSNIEYFIYALVLTLIPSILVFMEPDTGAVIIYFLIFITFIFMRKYNKWFYIISALLLFCIILIFIYLYLFQRDLFIKVFGTTLFYRIDRITNFLNRDGYQRNQALASL